MNYIVKRLDYPHPDLNKSGHLTIRTPLVYSRLHTGHLGGYINTPATLIDTGYDVEGMILIKVLDEDGGGFEHYYNPNPKAKWIYYWPRRSSLFSCPAYLVWKPFIFPKE